MLSSLITILNQVVNKEKLFYGTNNFIEEIVKIITFSRLITLGI